jgi:hypothetical protein
VVYHSDGGSWLTPDRDNLVFRSSEEENFESSDNREASDNRYIIKFRVSRKVEKIFPEMKMSGCVGCGNNGMATNQNTNIRLCAAGICGGRCNGRCPKGSTCHRNQYGIYSCVATPPWYKTWWGILILVIISIIGVLLIIGMIWWIRRSRMAATTPVVTTQYPGGMQVQKPYAY